MSVGNKQQGLSLIEILLVLIIAMVLIAMGIRMYQSYNSDLEIIRLKNNVNILFQALANYYRANCVAYTHPIKAGQLDPAMTPPNPFPIDIEELYNNKLLLTWPFKPIYNRYVNYQGRAYGYVVQFNLVEEERKEIASSFPPSPTPSTTTIGKNYFWKAQVAVELRDPTNAEYYKNLFAADCISAYDDSIKGVTPCDSANGGNYLVWERLPSLATPELMTDLWQILPNTVQFQQMYNTYPISHLRSGLITNQYFLCGG